MTTFILSDSYVEENGEIKTDRGVFLRSYAPGQGLKDESNFKSTEDLKKFLTEEGRGQTFEVDADFILGILGESA